MEDRSGSRGNERTVRGSVIRKFAAYMNGIGGAAYVLPEKMYGHTNAFVPYIFTDDELICLFTEIDKIHSSASQPYKHEMLPVMFRLIYTCGLRPAEARILKTENVYLRSGEVLITGTKRNKDRIVESENLRYSIFQVSNCEGLWKRRQIPIYTGHVQNRRTYTQIYEAVSSGRK